MNPTENASFKKGVTEKYCLRIRGLRAMRNSEPRGVHVPLTAKNASFNGNSLNDATNSVKGKKNMITFDDIELFLISKLFHSKTDELLLE